MSSPGIELRTDLSFSDALERVPAALKQEGFGVLTRVDVHDTLATKLGVTFRRTTILGACNPPLAHQALTATMNAALMMPCNVVVYEGDDGRAVINAVDPEHMAAGLGDARLTDVALAVKQKLVVALSPLGAAR